MLYDDEYLIAARVVRMSCGIENTFSKLFYIDKYAFFKISKLKNQKKITNFKEFPVIFKKSVKLDFQIVLFSIL